MPDRADRAASSSTNAVSTSRIYRASPAGGATKNKIAFVDGWQISTATIFNFAVHRAALEHFAQAGMPALRAKSRRLTAYLEFLIDRLNSKKQLFEIITPRDPDARGAQLSILTDADGKALFDYLADNGVICDWREPNVIRVAPAPLYNSFEDVFRFAELLQHY